MTICFNYASRSRPEKFFDGLTNIIMNCKSKNYFVVVKLDWDDEEMNQQGVRNRLLEYSPEKVRFKWGYSKSKIDAINRDLTNIPDWAILVNYSDDMKFVEYGFDEVIRADMQKYFPGLDGLLSYPDGYAPSDLCTMSIMGKKFYERFGYIYHPDYYSLWCDNEQSEVARLLGKFQSIPTKLYDHLHYAPGKAQKDALYRRNDTYHADRLVYEARKAKNFDL